VAPGLALIEVIIINMENKNIYIIVGVVVIILLITFAIRKNDPAPPSETADEQSKTEGVSATTSTGSRQVQTAGTNSEQTAKQTGNQTSITDYVIPSNLPNIDFIDERIIFPLKDFPDVKVTIEKVAFGRGETVVSTGCSGIPNTNFSTYLYPGSGICISADKVDGSPRGIVAFHLLVENNGNIGFGGNSDILKLHYLRSDSTGKPSYRFAYPVMGLASYYISGYSSKEMILSYLVPEDQLIFNLVSGYKEPIQAVGTSSVYDFSTNGLLVDFGLKNINVVK